jgi:hypothetical protein
MNTVAGLKGVNPFRIEERILQRIEKQLIHSTEDSEEPFKARFAGLFRVCLENISVGIAAGRGGGNRSPEWFRGRDESRVASQKFGETAESLLSMNLHSRTGRLLTPSLSSTVEERGIDLRNGFKGTINQLSFWLGSLHDLDEKRPGRGGRAYRKSHQIKPSQTKYGAGFACIGFFARCAQSLISTDGKTGLTRNLSR